MIDRDRIDGFDWDEANREWKNWLKHQVAAGECEEVFFNLPLLLQADAAHSQAEPRDYVLGRSNVGRYLFIAFTLRRNKIRVISARDMSHRERAVYDEAAS